GDDKKVRDLAARLACPVIFVGQKEDNDYRATEVAMENGGLQLRVNGSKFQAPGAGKHHLTAVLIAIAIGRQVEFAQQEIARGLASFEAAPGRSRPMQIGVWRVIDDTYNASPASMTAACQTLKDWQTDGKKILVAGDMLALGDWSSDFHRLFGEEAARAKLD